MISGDNFLSIAALTGSWFATTGLFWNLFERVDKAATDEAKEKLFNWISEVRFEIHLRQLALSFGRAFDTVFGTKHLSWRCFFRSCVASIISTLIIMVIWISIRPDEAKLVWELNRYTAIGNLLLFILVFNLLPDYLSLLETRLIIKKIHAVSKGSSMLPWLVTDFALTTGISLLLWVVIFAAFALISLLKGYNNTESLSNFIDALSNQVFILSNDGDNDIVSPGVMFYSTYFTSVWLWLYCLSGILSRMGSFIGVTSKFIRKYFIRKDRPFIGLGAISVVIITIGYVFFSFIFIIVA